MGKQTSSKIDFTYTITNDGNNITKKFDWTAPAQDVVLTLLSALISDIKANIDPNDYEKMLNFIWTQYAEKLLPDMLEKSMVEWKEDAVKATKEMLDK